MNSSSYFLGMNSIWWFVLTILIFWIFVTPYDIPFQRTKRNTPKNIIKKRLANGQITNQEYHHILTTLEK